MTRLLISNAAGGHLSHTGTFATEDKSINGLSVGELGCNLLFCGYFGVLMVFLSGDEACTQEARELIPGIETVAVKWVVKRGSTTGLSGRENMLFNGAAIHLSPAKYCESIRAGVKQALEKRHEIEPFKMKGPYKMIYTLRPNGETPARRAIIRHEDVLELLTLQMDPGFEAI